ncbi:DUF1858 domain-containing protein [Limosilactobacillus sp. STM2_1]|uniref:DUF1858 domain-containing protein n=1 Tax=Limosilactobacillus rudii TaxID=2759755 RepID=A0A7W3UMC2_9LACO|nr:DUF1858 domain-containing protein [Limosilactobacillus rudii]MBB1078897.1 DUF1858 domain-containing protein [Limosilactobacillus rudii]MBB1098227.1 DUF1858 domain-containing protein [Limosilactobacillus rudii]MCD7135658.1 DUF1858 domain-containing protein [Limosilactobacillus rudii]
MGKVIDFNLPIKQLADKYDNFVPLMIELGFTKIKIPGMLESVGRIVNLNKGCRAMGIDKQRVRNTFIQHGFEVINDDN